MSTSTSTVTPTNIPLAPMRVTFNSVDLGGTTDSVAVNVKYTLADIMVDQFGKTVLDSKVSGQEVTVKLVLAEAKNKDNWKVAFPSMKEVLTSTKLGYFDIQTGDSLLARSFQLVLHPLDAANGDLTTDFTFYKAAAMEASEVKYGPEKQTGLQVTFRIFPDSTSSPPRFCFYGDPAVGVVNAVVGSATAGSNTGNGTIGTISGSNQFTKTETITITEIGTGGSSANVFKVVGSVSGILGTFNLASTSTSTTSFTSGPINFTATQGTVQFVLADSFTISTTAANYS